MPCQLSRSKNCTGRILPAGGLQLHANTYVVAFASNGVGLRFIHPQIVSDAKRNHTCESHEKASKINRGGAPAPPQRNVLRVKVLQREGANGQP